VRTSKALWIPVIWVALGASRTVSQWLGLSTHALSTAEALEGNPLDRNVMAALMTFGMIALCERQRKTGRALLASWPILAFFLYCGVSIVWSDFPEIAFKRWMKAIGDLVMALIVLTDADPAAAFKRFVARLSFVLVPASVLLIKYFPALGQWNKAATGKLVYTGVATDKNMLGVICLLCGLVTAGRVLRAWRDRKNAPSRKPLIAQLVVLAMVGWLFARAGSMTALGTFVLGTFLLFATMTRTIARRPALVHVLVIVVLVGASFPLFFDAGAGVLETVGRDATLTGRTSIWDDALALAGNPIGGAGFESFWLGPRLDILWAKYWWHPNEAHNGYLEVFLNLGWVGVALMTIIIIRGYRNAVARLRTDPEAGGVALVFVVVGLIYALTEAAFRMLHPVWFFFILGSCGPAIAKAREVAGARRLTVAAKTPPIAVHRRPAVPVTRVAGLHSRR
jgi:exopolysaccharide production protein ExoQ